MPRASGLRGAALPERRGLHAAEIIAAIIGGAYFVLTGTKVTPAYWKAPGSFLPCLGLVA